MRETQLVANTEAQTAIDQINQTATCCPLTRRIHKSIRSTFGQQLGTIQYQCKLVSSPLPTTAKPARNWYKWILYILCPCVLLQEKFCNQPASLSTIRRRRRNARRRHRRRFVRRRRRRARPKGRIPVRHRKRRGRRRKKKK